MVQVEGLTSRFRHVRLLLGREKASGGLPRETF